VIAARTETPQPFPAPPALPPPSADPPTGTHVYLLKNSRLGLFPKVPIWEPGFLVRNHQNALGLQAELRQTRVGPRCSGKERDVETGLDYFGARYLSAAQGRWTSPDWSARQEPVPYASLGDPQTLNLYAYVRNDPLSRRDLDGHGGCTFFQRIVGLCKKGDDSEPKPPPKQIGVLATPELFEASRQPRTLSPEGAAFIRSYERFRAKPHLPTPKDKPTIGYGHVIKRGENFKNGITEPQAQALFQKDAAWAEAGVNKSITVWTPQSAFDAFVSLTFNIGTGGFERSSVAAKTDALAPVAEGDFTQYNKQKGDVLQGLTNRREDEVEMYSGGDYERNH
jgi:RHS repeat-associated protein